MRVAVIGCGSMGLLAHLPARNFARAVEGLDEPIAPGEQGCLALEAVVGAYASAARQPTVRLPLDPDDVVYQRGVEALLEDEAVAV